MLFWNKSSQTQFPEYWPLNVMEYYLLENLLYFQDEIDYSQKLYISSLFLIIPWKRSTPLQTCYVHNLVVQCPVLWVFTYFKSYLGHLRVLSTQTGMIPQQRAKQLRFPLNVFEFIFFRSENTFLIFFFGWKFGH